MTLVLPLLVVLALLASGCTAPRSPEPQTGPSASPDGSSPRAGGRSTPGSGDRGGRGPLSGGARAPAGPAEAAALAFDPPLAFRWSYTVLQVGGAFGGWALGAAVGPGTLITALLVGPAVDLTTRTVFRGSGSPSRSSTQAPLPEPC